MDTIFGYLLNWRAWVLLLVLLLLIKYWVALQTKAKAIFATIPGASAANKVQAYKDLVLVLTHFIIDYVSKIYYFARNLPYFPLGIDHRLFKRRLKHVVLKDGKLELHDEENRFYVGLRPTYLLICLSTYAIAIWVLHSISSALGPFVHSKEQLFLYSVGGAIAVFACDVAILRSMTMTKAIGLSERGGGAQASKFWIYTIRVVVVGATATLLAFSISMPIVSDQLDDELRRISLESLRNTSRHRALETSRQSLLTDLHHLNGDRYCLRFTVRGVKKGDLPTYVDKRGENLEGYTKLLPAVGLENVDRTYVDMPCAHKLLTNEEPCPGGVITPGCRHATSKAQELYRSAVRLVGRELAIIHFLPHQTDAIGFADRIDREFQMGGQSELNRVSNQLNQQLNLLKVAEELKAYREPLCPESAKGLWAWIETKLRPMAFRCDYKDPNAERLTGLNKARLDVNQVAAIVIENLSSFYSVSRGMILVLALIVIFAMFELLVLITKSTGTLGHHEFLLGRFDHGYIDDFLKGRSNELVESEGRFVSDVGLPEHVFAIGRALFGVINVHMNSVARGFLLNVPFLVIALWLIWEGLGGFLDDLLGDIRKCFAGSKC